MKTPKLIDADWLESESHINPIINTTQYHTGYIEAIRNVICRLKPLPSQPTTTKTNVDKIRAGEMAIEDDDKEALRKCCVSLFKDSDSVGGNYKYYFAWEVNLNMWHADNATTLPTIKASELIKEIEGGECKKFCGENYCDENGCTNRKRLLVEPIDLTPEWQPNFGEVVETRDNDFQDWDETIYLGTKDGEHHCVGYEEEKKFNINHTYSVSIWNQIRPKQTPTLTLAEAEAKLGVKIIT